MADKSEDFTGLLNSIDEITELIYVSDLETYDLLYMNKAGRKAFSSNAAAGGKCYQVLQKRDSPCPFSCPFGNCF